MWLASAGCGIWTVPDGIDDQALAARPALDGHLAPPDRQTLRQWARTCSLDDGQWATLSPSVRAALPDRHLHPELCRRYQMHLVRTPGIWGDTTMLMMLGLLKGVRVATYELRQPEPGPPAPQVDPPAQQPADATATAACPGSSAAAPVGGSAAAPEDRDPDAPALGEVVFAEWIGASASPVEVHLVNLYRGHWQAFVPATAVSPRACGGMRVVGARVEAGGGGDCMYYAFLASLDAQEGAAAALLAGPSARRRMLALRQQLGAYLQMHWQTPVNQLGGAPDNTMTLGALSCFGEPREFDPLGP